MTEESLRDVASLVIADTLIISLLESRKTKGVFWVRVDLESIERILHKTRIFKFINSSNLKISNPAGKEIENMS